MTSLRAGLACCVAYVMLAGLLAGHPGAAEVFLGVGAYFAPGLVLWAILRRWHDWSGCQRLFWAAFLIAILLFTASLVALVLNELLVGWPVAVSLWQTLLQLFRLTAPLVAVLARPQKGPRKADLPAVALDLAGAGIVAAFVYSFFVIAPDFGPAGHGQAAAALALFGRWQRPALLAALLWSIYDARGTRWQPTFWRLAGGLSLGLALSPIPFDALLGPGALSGSMQHLSLLVPQVFYAWAAAEAPASEALPDAVESVGSHAPLLMYGALLVVPVIAYVGAQRWPLPDPLASFRILTAGGALVSLLGLLVGRFAVQQTALERADARARLLAKALEQTDNLVLIVQRDGTFEFANDAFCRAVRRSAEDLRGVPIAALFAEGTGHLSDELTRTALRRGSGHGTALRRRADGSTFPTACSVVPLVDPVGQPTHFVWVERDITEDLRLRDKLIQSERLSAVGQLVAGVAHEVNNPLQSIVGFTELMLATPYAAEIRDDVAHVRESAMRAGNIVRHLLTFARKSPRDREAAELNEVVETALALRAAALRAVRIEVEEDYQPELPAVRINRDEIQQLIVSLLVNAEEAMQASGDERRIRVRTGAFGGTVVLDVIDTGPGVPPGMAGRIFEPFFTTKQVGQGSGLGLSIAFGIASAHGGTLELVPTASGACFRLTLPARPQTAAGRVA